MSLFDSVRQWLNKKETNEPDIVRVIRSESANYSIPLPIGDFDLAHKSDDCDFDFVDNGSTFGNFRSKVYLLYCRANGRDFKQIVGENLAACSTAGITVLIDKGLRLADDNLVFPLVDKLPPVERIGCIFLRSWQAGVMVLSVRLDSRDPTIKWRLPKIYEGWNAMQRIHG